MLSILVPVRNAGQFIGSCLESIYEQGGLNHPIEVLISDNCSEDDTTAIITNIADKYRRANHPTNLTLFRQATNLGAYGNLNFLLERATYRHATILCADDYYSGPGAVAAIVAVIKRHPEAALFAFDNNTRHQDQAHWKMARLINGDQTIDPLTFQKLLLAFGCFLGGLSNLCVDRERFREIGYFDPAYYYYGDFEFYARAAIRGANLYLSSVPTTFRRHHSQSISSTGNRANARVAESIATIAALDDNLTRLAGRRRYSRIYATLLLAQFYDAALKALFKNRCWEPLRKVAETQRRTEAFYRPIVTLLIAILIWPKIYRNRLSLGMAEHFVRTETFP